MGGILAARTSCTAMVDRATTERSMSAPRAAVSAIAKTCAFLRSAANTSWVGIDSKIERAWIHGYAVSDKVGSSAL
jgi:hypothetical protein